MKILSPIGDYYAKHLEAFSNDKEKIHSDVLFQLFYDLYNIRKALYNYKDNVKRGKAWSIADILHDLIGKYLRIKLSDDYEVFLEYKEKGKQQPDIMIKKEGKNWAIIEVKTNLGWTRDFIKKESDKSFKTRIDDLSNAYGVPSKRVFYVLENPTNAGKDFERIWYDDKKEQDDEKWHKEIKEAILPLFKGMVGLKDKFMYGNNTDQTIKDRYDEERLTPFSDILEKVE